MRHVIFGGDGFVGRYLAPKLLADGHEVLVADIVKSDLPHYTDAAFIATDVTDPEAIRRLGIRADDMVYNLSAKMLSPIQVRARGGRGGRGVRHLFGRGLGDLDAVDADARMWLRLMTR